MGSALLSPYLLVYDLVAMMPFAVERMLARCKHRQVPALANFLAPFAGLSLVWLTISLIMPHRLSKPKGAEAARLV